MGKRKPEDPLRALNPRERRFVTYYLKSGNATQSAIKAGYTPKTADAKAPAWVGKSREKSSNGRIWDAVQYKRSELEEKSCDLEERIMREYQRLAFSDIRKLYKADGTLKKITDLDDDAAAALEGLDVSVTMSGNGEDSIPLEIKKFKMASKKPALDSLSKILGLFMKDNEQKQLSLEKLMAAIAAVSTEDLGALKARLMERLNG